MGLWTVVGEWRAICIKEATGGPVRLQDKVVCF